MRVVQNLDELIEHIHKVKPKFIVIDGRDGAGKTYLAKQLSNELGGTHLTEENYRGSDDDYNLKPKFDEIILDIARSSSNSPMIFDCVLMSWVIDECGLKPDLKIYVKSMTSMGLWSDDIELDDGMTKDEALSKATSMGASNFRKQMISYHFEYLPHKTADLIYERME